MSKPVPSCHVKDTCNKQYHVKDTCSNQCIHLRESFSGVLMSKPVPSCHVTDTCNKQYHVKDTCSNHCIDLRETFIRVLMSKPVPSCHVSRPPLHYFISKQSLNSRTKGDSYKTKILRNPETRVQNGVTLTFLVVQSHTAGQFWCNLEDVSAKRNIIL